MFIIITNLLVNLCPCMCLSLDAYISKSITCITSCVWETPLLLAVFVSCSVLGRSHAPWSWHQKCHFLNIQDYLFCQLIINVLHNNSIHDLFSVQHYHKIDITFTITFHHRNNSFTVIIWTKLTTIVTLIDIWVVNCLRMLKMPFNSYINIIWFQDVQ